MAIGALATLAVVVVGGLGGRALLRPERSGSPAHPQERSVEPPKEDRLALALIKDLRPSFCRSYGFYFRKDLGPDEYRPVQCGAEIKVLGLFATESGDPSPSPSLTPLDYLSRQRIVRGPDVVVYAFASSDAQRAWLEAHAAPWGGRIGGSGWVVDVTARGSFDRVHRSISDHDQTIVVHSTSEWSVKDHLVEPVPTAFRPRTPLRRASKSLTAGDKSRELLGTTLGLYSDSRRERVPAWIVTFGSCLPSYADEAPGRCLVDRWQVVLGAATGKRITAYSG
jgi:hypothetical protein